MTFQELGLNEPILRALADQGYEQPSPIQAKAIPPALTGRDVLGCAQTGTGKTCAFAAPILQRLSGRKAQGRPIRALILTPTRELALQIQESFEAYGKYLPLRSTVIFGGVGQAPQVERLKKGVDILVATPGRLGDLYGQKLIDLSRLEIFVLDEADRMLDMGFIHDVRRILGWLPAQKQTLFFSATMPPEVQGAGRLPAAQPRQGGGGPHLLPGGGDRPEASTTWTRGNKTRLLAALIRDLGVKNALVFTRTKHGANKVAGDLVKAGISAAAIHGNKSQTARQQALADFKAARCRSWWPPTSPPGAWTLRSSPTCSTTTCPTCRRPTSTASAAPAGPGGAAPPSPSATSARRTSSRPLRSSSAAPSLWWRTTPGPWRCWSPCPATRRAGW